MPKLDLYEVRISVRREIVAEDGYYAALAALQWAREHALEEPRVESFNCVVADFVCVVADGAD